MDYRSNEDYYYRQNGYKSGVGNGLYNLCYSTNIDWSANVTEPVTLADIKAWGKIDQSVDDDILRALITAARIICEQYTNTGFVSRSIVADINNANGGFMLPYGPVTSTPTAVNWEGTALTVEYSLNQLNSPMGRMSVSYTGGYSTLPEVYKTAIKEQVLYLYDNRGDRALSNRIAPMAQIILNPLIRSK